MRRFWVCVAVFAFVAAIVACSDDSPAKIEPTATARPLPSPVALPTQPAGDYTLRDAGFEAWPGARAEFGRLGGTVYRLEVPDNWNRRLVLFLHGSHDNTTELFVEDPSIREHLIEHGYAWAASSYNANADRTSNHARDSAALWDFAASRLGRPDYSYVMGNSVGGLGTVLSAIQYGERYDGALAVCANANAESAYDYRGSALFVAGAYVAGITQEEFTGADIDRLVEERIKPALADPAARMRFEDIVIDLSGGDRPFAREGLRIGFDQVWEYAAGVVEPGLLNNADRVYTFSESSGIDAADFNARAVRNHDFNTYLDGLNGDNETYTGDLQAPLLTLHTTGDAPNPLYWEQVLHESVAAAGKQNLLVQRAVKAAGHCTQTDGEYAAAFDALVAWVEQGQKPEGEDLTGSLADAGKFTLTPRISAAPDADVIEWLVAICGLDRAAGEETDAIPGAALDPSTLTLEERRARAERLWIGQARIEEEHVAALDQLTPPERVRALHDAFRAIAATTASEDRRSLAEIDQIFTSVDAVEANNARLQASDDVTYGTADDLFVLDAPLLALYRSHPDCA